MNSAWNNQIDRNINKKRQKYSQLLNLNQMERLATFL